MTADPAFFHDLAWVIVAAVVGGVLAWLARQPVVLGYLVGGVLVGRFTPGPTVSDVHTFELFAEIGVVLLMFSIGIEFSFRDLLRVRWVALLGGPLGIILTAAAGVATGAILGWPVRQGLAIGLIVSVASTMVLVRLLMDRGELHTRHGRLMIGISLVEDLAVVALTILLPALAGESVTGRPVAVAIAMGKAALVLIPVVWLAFKGVPPLMRYVARTQNDELFLLVVLAIGLGTGALTQAAGLSVALGAFLAGLTISTSDYAHETLARLLPLRDVFVAMFFVTVGMLVDPFSVAANLPLLGAMLALTVVGKGVGRTVLLRVFGYPLATAARAGVGLAQIGEFSFILVQVARQAGVVGDDVYNATLAASLLTILLNALLVRYVTQWLDSATLGRARRAVPEATPPGQPVVLCGYGRVGSEIGEALETFGVPYAVIERDPEICAQLRARGVRCVFGDAAHRELLAHAGVETAPLVILALPEIDRAQRAVRATRALRPDVPLLARAHGRVEAEALRAMGVTEVIQPELEASATLIRHALASLGLPKERVIAYLERFRGAMDRAEAATATGALPEVRELTIGTGDVTDRSLRDARIRERFGVTVVALRRAEGPLLNPPPETILRPGDVVRVFGLPEQIEAFARAAG